jgi:hypothetical protein
MWANVNCAQWRETIVYCPQYFSGIHFCVVNWARYFSDTNSARLGGTQVDGVPQLIFRNLSVPLLLLYYNHNAQPVLETFFFLKLIESPFFNFAKSSTGYKFLYNKLCPIEILFYDSHLALPRHHKEATIIVF